MTKKNGIGSHQSHNMGKDEWLTPPHILDAFPEFDLDPCAPISPPWKMAKKTFTLTDNGLSKEWVGRVWCNPPYGLEASKWLERMVVHGDGIALIFARTETKMFFAHVWDKAHAVLFLDGRLFFHHVDGTRAKSNAGAPSVLIAYGSRSAELLKNCGIKGKYITLIRSYYPVVIQDNNHKKLLAIQTKPSVKYWLKDKEVSIEKLTEALQGITI